MRLRNKALALFAGFVLGVGGAAQASALSLQDLVANGTTDLGNITIRNVVVKAKKGTDLSQYLVTPLANGFTVQAPGSPNGKSKKLTLSYSVDAESLHHLVQAALEMNGSGALVGKFSASSDLRSSDGKLKYDVLGLFETSKGSKKHDDGLLADLTTLRVTEKLSFSGRASGESVSRNFMTTPEPSAMLLLSGGLAGLALIGRKRAR